MTINTVLLLEAFTVVTIEKAHACITYYIQRTSKCLCNEWEDCVRRAILKAEAAVHATCGISRVTDQLVGKVGRPSVVDPSIDRSIDRSTVRSAIADCSCDGCRSCGSRGRGGTGTTTITEAVGGREDDGCEGSFGRSAHN